MFDQSKVRFNEAGLVPAVAQDALSGEVLMLAYMNQESLAKTLETGKAHYYSRSRQKLWMKGETSGHVQRVVGIFLDCDGDTILLKVEQTGPACHTGNRTCFSQGEGDPGSGVLREVYDTICDRRANPVEGSYTNYLFDKGVDKMCKKVGEEAAEVIIGAKNGDPAEVRYEVADLFYHVMVVLAQIGLTPEDIYRELAGRRK